MNINKLVRRVLLEIDETGKEVKKQVDLNNPSSVLDLASNDASCFPKKNLGIGGLELATKDLATACGVSEGTPLVKGKTPAGTTLYFFGSKTTKSDSGDGKFRFQDGKDQNGDPHFGMCTLSGSTYTKITDPTSPTWFCEGVFRAVADLNTAQLTQDQYTQLNNYVTKIGASYSQKVPEGQTEQEFEKYDVKNIKLLGDTFVNFPANTMYVWVRKGLLNANPDQLLELKNELSNLTPKLSTDIPKVLKERVSYCVTPKGLFPTTDYMPRGIDYESLKVRIDDPISGLKKGQDTLFCPDDTSLNEIKKSANNMDKCRQSVKFLYACKTNPRRANKLEKRKPSDNASTVDGNKCDDFKTVFYNRYLTYVCNSKSFKMYDRTVDILGMGIKKEVNDLLSDYTTDFGIGTFQQGLRESVKTSNTLDYTINKFVFEAIKGKKTKSVDPIGYVVKKNLLEEFKRRRK